MEAILLVGMIMAIVSVLAGLGSTVLTDYLTPTIWSDNRRYFMSLIGGFIGTWVSLFIMYWIWLYLIYPLLKV